jgi:1,4-dihydroxy-6-naphthoate synthase
MPIPALTRVLRIGHSPDPDDAFMFCALAKGAVRIRDFAIEHVLEDIETLNRRALSAELEVTAISAHAYLSVAESYWVLATGASMGEGYGPVLVARREMSPESLVGKKVAIPGEKTTAALLARLYLGDFVPLVRPFDAIFEAVDRGEAEAGVLIHEGQLTYAASGYCKILDFGERWEEETGLPLPLGLDVVRSDLGIDLAREINRALSESIDWAYRNEAEALDYALQFGRGLARDLGRRFVRMYVSELTRDMGERGEKALNELFRRAAAAGVSQITPRLAVIR